MMLANACVENPARDYHQKYVTVRMTIYPAGLAENTARGMVANSFNSALRTLFDGIRASSRPGSSYKSRSLGHRCDQSAQRVIDRLGCGKHPGYLRVNDDNQRTFLHAIGKTVGARLAIVEAVFWPHVIRHRFMGSRIVHFLHSLCALALSLIGR